MASDVPNPTAYYVAGGTLSAEATSYVQRSADGALLSSLKAGKFCYVLNSRQMGKSSLCVRTMRRLEAEGVRTAFVDLTKIGGRNVTPEQWYAGIAMEVGRSLELRNEFLAYWKDNGHLSPVQRLFGALRDVALEKSSQHLVVFFDEIDATRSLSFSADEFFAAVRESYNRRVQDTVLERLTFCLIGAAVPSDLIQSPTSTPFNIGERVIIRDFTEAEALAFAKGLDRPGSADLVRRVHFWTGGQPFMTQSLCAAVAADPSVKTPSHVDKMVMRDIVDPSARESNVNLADVATRALHAGDLEPDPDKFRADLLSTYQVVLTGGSVLDDESNRVSSLLKISGLVRAEGKCLKVRNRIYKQVFDKTWILENMPDAELRRQKAAYKRGLTKAIAWGGVIVIAFAIVGGLAVSNAAQSQSAKALAVEERKRADRLLYEAEMRLVQQGWDSDNLGQSLSILEATRNSPYKGFEWYYWQRQVHPPDLMLTLRGHADWVNSATFSPDGRRIASASDDRTVRVWNAETGQELLCFRGHSGEVKDIAFSPDGRRVASASFDKTAKVWDSETGKEILTLKGHTQGLWGVAFSPDGKLLATVSKDRTARIWDASIGTALRTLSGHTGWIVPLAFLPDGRRLATGGNDSAVKVWDISSGHETVKFDGHNDYVNCVLCSSDGKRLVTASSDRTVKVWDTITGTKILDLKQPDLVFGLALSPDSRTLATAVGESVHLLEARTGREISAIRGHANTVFSVDFSPDGKRLATGSYDKTVRVWDLASAGRTSVLAGHSGFVMSVALSPDGDQLATASFDKTVRTWDIKTGACLTTLRGPAREVMEVTYSPNGHRLASACNDGTAKIWDLDSGSIVLTLSGHKSDMNSLAYSPDGKYLATGSSDNTVKVWDALTGRNIRTLSGHTAAVLRVRFSPNGKCLASASEDRTVTVWDFETGKALGVLKGHTRGIYGLAYSPDGRRLATGAEDGTAIVWDVATGARALTLPGHRSTLQFVEFSPDGSRLATCGETVKLWDAQTGHEVLTLRDHLDWVSSLAFSLDGKQIYTSSYDKTVRIWDSATPVEVEQWEREEKKAGGK